MTNWYLVTVVGRDQPGIVAAVTGALATTGSHLADTSMIQMADNFTIMMMLQSPLDPKALHTTLAQPASRMQLHIHVDAIRPPHTRSTPVPDTRIVVHGADRAGIVADVTAILAKSGFNIIDLESARGGAPEAPIYIMTIEGLSPTTPEQLLGEFQQLTEGGIELQVDSIETLIG